MTQTVASMRPAGDDPREGAVTLREHRFASGACGQTPGGAGQIHDVTDAGRGRAAQTQRILLISSTHIGDCVQSTSLLVHLLRTYPEARFTVACGPTSVGVFQRMPRLEAVVPIVKRRFGLHWLVLWRRLVGCRWDLVVDLRGSALSALLRARRRRVQHGRVREARLTYLSRVLDLTAPPMPVLWTSAEDEAVADRLLLADRALVGLGVTANWAGKAWPGGRFAEVAAAVMPRARVVLLGGPGAKEAAMAAAARAAMPDAIDLIGRLSLPEAAAVLARLDLFIGNDSGLMHMAAAAGVPTLGLFGPSPAAIYAPVGRWTATVVAPGPAGRAPIEGLEVGAVTQAAGRLLAAVAAHAAN